MNYFTTKQTHLQTEFFEDFNENDDVVIFLHLLDKINASKYLKRTSIVGRKPYNLINMLAATLYGFAKGKGTLRDLEDLCKNDRRFIYIMNGVAPSHTTFATFINNHLTKSIDQIMVEINKNIMIETNKICDTLFIDGTKFEANCNKYKFVWKPTKFHENLNIKIQKVLSEINFFSNNNFPIKQRYSSIELNTILESYKDELINKNINFNAKRGRGHKISNELRLYFLLQKFLEKTIEYETKESICGENRKSYGKSDHDATFMELKTDYYSHTGQMRAAYNMQIGVFDGFIMQCGIFQNRTDYGTFIPFLEKYKQNYNRLPKYIVADAGYGSQNNYSYLESINRPLFTKYTMYEKDHKGKGTNDLFKMKDDSYICLNGNIGTCLYSKPNGTKIYKFEGCKICPFSKRCRRGYRGRDSNARNASYNKDFIEQKRKVIKNLETPKGIELRVNRSIQVEGAFGVIKQDMEYNRCRRRGINNVNLEFNLVCIGYNIKKYIKYKQNKIRYPIWTLREYNTHPTM